jgi:aspartyl aminopeptidase
MSKKIEKKEKKNKLLLERKSCLATWSDATISEANKFCEDYKVFVNNKTEREVVRASIKLAEQNGFTAWESIASNIAKYNQKDLVGKKIYFVNREKNIFLVVLGKQDIAKGINMIIAHIDSPRLDLKVNPLYEDEEIAFFKTHYYGGIKKYQWPTIPLAIHGVVVLADGKKVDICIGEEEADPIFMISDLLPHLGKEQMKKELSHAIEGEELNVILGSKPSKGKKDKQKVKQAILEHLNAKYGIIEEDFFSAEIQIVPSQKARDLGFDRSLIAAYGQDDRSNAFCALQAIFDVKNPEKTMMTVLTDKEEIGSVGFSSMRSTFLEGVVEKLIKLTKSDGTILDIFSNSKALSADVAAGYDPDYKQVHDHRNVARLNYGVVLERHTGHGGKYNSSEASAEFICELRKMFNENNIVWQTGGLGKVDQGGGGTIAMYLANRNIDVIDCGIAIFNTHAPMEISSKADIYCAYLAYKVFYSFSIRL